MLRLRGMGEVWNCPHSSSASTITATAAAEDTKSWSVTNSFGTKLGGFGAALESKLVVMVAGATSITKVTTISATLQAAWCHRIPWQAFFDVAKYEAEVDYEVVRRFAWWTKNRMTGDRVRRHGEIWIPCGSGTASLGAQAPIAGHFQLSQRACNDPACRSVTSKDLGFFPPLPVPHSPTTPSSDEPDPEERDPDVVDPTEPALPAEGPTDVEDADDEVPPSRDLPDPPAGMPTDPLLPGEPDPKEAGR